jgi:hypothetical protein
MFMRRRGVAGVLRTAVGATLAAGWLSSMTPSAQAQDLSSLDKGHRLLIENGLQVSGLVNTGDVFHESTYQGLNYTSVLWWQAGSNPSAAPDMPWIRSVPDPSQMPDQTPSEQGAYLNKLVALQLGDEQYMDGNPDLYNQTVQWFQQAQSNPTYANTILYLNSWGSELSDGTLSNFIQQAKPDMVSFDTYPWVQGQDPAGGSPTDWYTWLRRYHVYSHADNIPFGVWRQTYHSTGDGRRDPSPSEQNLNSFAALAYGATYLADFTYNTGASSMFDRYTPSQGAGDSLPNAIYARQAIINAQVRNLGPALVRLTQIDDQAPGTLIPNKGQYDSSGPHTTNMMIIRGKHLDGSGNVQVNDLPAGFVEDPNAPTDPTKVNYSDWVTTGNDPYLNGGFTFNGPNTFGVKNLGTHNLDASGKPLPGDVIISWFKPMLASFEGDPKYANERYFMVVNGLTGNDPGTTAADYRQEILLDFLINDGSGINSLQELDPNTGQVDVIPLTSLGSNKWRLTLDLDGGMGALFKFNDGAPFVGIDAVPEPASLGLMAVAGVMLVRRRRRGRQ